MEGLSTALATRAMIKTLCLGLNNPMLWAGASWLGSNFKENERGFWQMNELHISSVSLWETSYKVEHGSVW